MYFKSRSHTEIDQLHDKCPRYQDYQPRRQAGLGHGPGRQSELTNEKDTQAMILQYDQLFIM